MSVGKDGAIVRERLRRLGAWACMALLAATMHAARGEQAALHGQAASGARETIRIGVPVPLSGNYASAGVDIVNGAKLAAIEINRNGGVLGRPIEIVAEDDACDANVAALAADKLVRAGISVAAGGYCSGAALPELTVFHRVGIAYVLDASTNPRLTELGFPEAFRLLMRDDRQGGFIADFIAQVLRAKNVLVIEDGTTYSKGLADGAMAALKANGAKASRALITPGQQDYSSALRQWAPRPPDVIFFTGYFAEAGLIVKQARALGLKSTFMASEGVTDATFMQIAGEAGNGALIATEPLPSFMLTARKFVREYERRYGQAPGPYSAYEYDAVRIAARAIEAAGSTRPADVVAALRRVRGYKGVTGEIAFDANGDREHMDYMTVIVRGGAFQPYKRRLADGRWVDAGK